MGKISGAPAAHVLRAVFVAAILSAGADSGAQTTQSVSSEPILLAQAGGGARPVAQAQYGMKAGSSLKVGEYLASQNAQFIAVMEADGNFAIYRGTSPSAKGAKVFETKTGGQPKDAYFAAMQADGNFVVYRSNGQPLYDTKTYGLGNGSYSVQLNADGTLTVQSATGVLWSSALGANPAFATAGGKQVAGDPAVKAAQAADAAKAAAAAALAKANAELAAAKAAAAAATAQAATAAATAKAAADSAAALAAAPFQSGGNILKTGKYLAVGQYMVSSSKTYFAIMQSDGNFCHYKGSGPANNQGEIWCSGTHGATGAYYTVMQSDGNFCVYKGADPKNSKGNLWCTAGQSAPTGDFYALIQDDSNFVVYQGRGPNANTTPVSLWNRISAAQASRSGWQKFKDDVTGALHTVVAGISDVGSAIAKGTVDAAEITASAAKTTANAAQSAADSAANHLAAATKAAEAAAKAAADAADAAAKATADAAASAAAATKKAATDSANAAAKAATDAANATANAAKVAETAADKAAHDAAAATVNTANTVAKGTVNTGHTVAAGTVGAYKSVTTEIVSTSNLVANDTVSVAVTVGRGVQQGGVIVGTEIVKDGKVVGYAIADVAKEAWAFLTGNCGVIGRTVFPLPVSAYFQGANQIASSLSKAGAVDPKTGKAIANVQASANQCYEKIQDGFYCSFPAELAKLVNSVGSMPGNMINMATRVFNKAKNKECIAAGVATISVAGAGAGMCGLGEVVVSDAQKAFACVSAAQSKGIMSKFLPSGSAAAQFPSDASCTAVGKIAFQVAEKVVTDGMSDEAKAAEKAGKGRTIATVAEELKTAYELADRPNQYNDMMAELAELPECKD